MTVTPLPPSNYNLHNQVEYLHGLSVLQICLLVILAAYGVYANPFLTEDVNHYVGGVTDIVNGVDEDVKK